MGVGGGEFRKGVVQLDGVGRVVEGEGCHVVLVIHDWRALLGHCCLLG